LFLEEDVAWLQGHGYRVDSFDASTWSTETQMHEDLGEALGFPDYYGNNLNAFNDCLSDLEIGDTGGHALVFRRYDVFAQNLPSVALPVLDIIAEQSRRFLLFGARLIALVQSDDPAISFPPVGATAVHWNRREWLNNNRGL
jgi:Barstar (barnase inhibitor)